MSHKVTRIFRVEYELDTDSGDPGPGVDKADYYEALSELAEREDNDPFGYLIDAALDCEVAVWELSYARDNWACAHCGNAELITVRQVEPR